jgi:gas vesicle protein GvpN
MKLIGRDHEQKLIEGMLKAGRHVLLEGAVGVGKTTLAIAVSDKLNRSVIRIDGDGRYTEQKLVGSFDPKLVLEKGFVRDAFVPGPLYRAMEEGDLLLINELNRMPEMVQNVLLPALDEGKIQIPVLGELKAQAGFAVIATQNPREFIATSSLSEALLDRMEWISIAPLSGAEEIEIVEAHLREAVEGQASVQAPSPIISDVPVEEIVALMRMTRSHLKIKRGASVRAAIAMAKIVQSTDADFWVVAKSVLANRIELEVGKFSNRPYSDLMDELLNELKSDLKKKS